MRVDTSKIAIIVSVTAILTFFTTLRKEVAEVRPAFRLVESAASVA